MGGGELEGAAGRPAWAVRFSATMYALNPGVQIAFRWLTRLVVLITVWRVPEALTWLT